MKSFRRVLLELKIARMFHVGTYQGKGPLKSASSLLGSKKAKEHYQKDWISRYGELEDYPISGHQDYVHGFQKDRESDAIAYLKIRQVMSDTEGKRKKYALYDIRPGRKMPPIETDTAYGHVKVKGEIPPQYVRNVWDPVKKKWRRVK